MASTVQLEVPKNEWTEVAVGALNECLVTSMHQGFFLYAAAQPDADFGHMLEPRRNLNLKPEVDQSVWVLCPYRETVVSVTIPEDQDPLPGIMDFSDETNSMYVALLEDF